MKFIMRLGFSLLVAACSGSSAATVTSHSEGERTVVVAEGNTPKIVDHEQLIASIALDFAQRQPTLKREDCSGFVEAVLQKAGVERRGSVRTFWRRALVEGRAYRAGFPKIGHLAFFDTTYDSNRNRFVDDTLTHIAIVAAVEEDGTVVLVHRPRSGIKKLRLHLSYPALHRYQGKVINEYLRLQNYGGNEGRRLAGQLVYGFAAPPRQFGCNCLCEL